ncbi:MAG: RNA polymerase sigma factor [Gammaproteobacteria bacterium]|nr:MAG: RNA polymerase sigma factor [Gammaproteobacteria bacterium]
MTAKRGLAPSDETSARRLILDFYRREHRALRQYLSQRLGSEDEAEDVAQQVYERLLGEPAPERIRNPKAFIYRAARNLAIDALRRRRLRGDDEIEADFDANDLPADDGGPEELAECVLTVERLLAVIAELPPKCRSAFLYYKFEERDYPEIARRLAVSESMVRKYVLRALVYCRARLEQTAES